MTTSLLWRHVSYEQVNELNSTLEPQTCKSLLADYLGLRQSSSQEAGGVSEEEVVLDLYFHTFALCKDKRFPESKTSTLLSIFKTLLEGDRRRLLIGTGNMKRSYEHLEKLLLEHAVERPPVSTGVFSSDDLRDITEFMLNGYYRHYRLYEYIMKGRVFMTLEQRDVDGVEPLKEFAPLAEGLLLAPEQS